ncbi:hypothetical protein JCM10908_006151 [Rhodotorula pacifica]|uniref:uncharacterized protein n=1 Tax=Rhodotorula pacifica TaxID=1495444 RepID=UPI003176DB43
MQQTQQQTATGAADARSQLFDNYVYYAAEAARIARDACEGTDELQKRIDQLESELQVWKLGHQEASKQARDAQKQLDIGDQIAYCVLDGDGCIFHRDLISKGREGGREAARQLSEHVTNYAEDQGVKGSVTVIIHIFVNKQGLGKVLSSCDIADEATFSAFLLGLNAAHPGILVSDVGAQKEASDAKLSHSLRLYAKLPSTKVVIAGAAHDGGYAHLFSSLETEAPLLFRKISLLKSYVESAFEIKRLSLRTTSFEGLFEPRKLVAYGSSSTNTSTMPTPKKAATPKPVATPKASSAPGPPPAVAAVVQNSSSTNATPKASKQESWNTVTAAKPAKASKTIPQDEGFTKVVKPVKLRPTDPSKPLFKQVPPVCNQHYLNPPCHDNCRYGHHYALTSAQLVELKANAKKSPCLAALKGKECRTPGCPLGHVCPYGAKCKYGDTCRFNTPGLHPPGTPGRRDGAAWKGTNAGFGVQQKSKSRSAGMDSDDDGFETTSSID